MDNDAQSSTNVLALHVAAAFLLVPGVVALFLAIAEPAYAGFESYFERVWRTALIFAVSGTYPMTLVFSVPAFIFLRDRVRPTAINCSLTGAAVAGLPWLIFTTFFGPDSASIGGRATVVDGSLTAYGWLANLTSIGQLSLFGLIGGYLFWLISVGCSRKSKAG